MTISYWGVEHGEDIGKSKYSDDSPARHWKIGRPLEKQGIKATPGATKRMTQEANRGAKRGMRRVLPATLGGGLVGAGIGAASKSPSGLVTGGAIGGATGFYGSLAAAMGSQNKDFRRQMDAEYRKGNVSYKRK